MFPSPGFLLLALSILRTLLWGSCGTHGSFGFQSFQSFSDFLEYLIRRTFLKDRRLPAIITHELVGVFLPRHVRTISGAEVTPIAKDRLNVTVWFFAQYEVAVPDKRIYGQVGVVQCRQNLYCT